MSTITSQHIMSEIAMRLSSKSVSNMDIGVSHAKTHLCRQRVIIRHTRSSIVLLLASTSRAKSHCVSHTHVHRLYDSLRTNEHNHQPAYQKRNRNAFILEKRIEYGHQCLAHTNSFMYRQRVIIGHTRLSYYLRARFCSTTASAALRFLEQCNTCCEGADEAASPKLIGGIDF